MCEYVYICGSIRIFSQSGFAGVRHVVEQRHGETTDEQRRDFAAISERRDPGRSGLQDDAAPTMTASASAASGGTAPAGVDHAGQRQPSRKRNSIKSTRMMPLRTTMPARHEPIIEWR